MGEITMKGFSVASPGMTLVRVSTFSPTVGCELPWMRSERLAWPLDKHDVPGKADLLGNARRINSGAAEWKR